MDKKNQANKNASAKDNKTKNTTANTTTAVAPQLIQNNPFLRAVQGGTSGAVWGLVLGLPKWFKSKKIVPPREVLTDIGVNAGISATSEFVESSIERIRGRTDDLWAPFIGTAFPYVAIESGRFAMTLKRKEKVDWKERTKALLKEMSFPVCSTLLIRSILLGLDKQLQQQQQQLLPPPALNKANK